MFESALIEHKPGHFAACHFAGEPLPAQSDPEGLNVARNAAAPVPPAGSAPA